MPATVRVIRLLGTTDDGTTCLHINRGVTGPCRRGAVRLRNGGRCHWVDGSEAEAGECGSGAAAGGRVGASVHKVV